MAENPAEDEATAPPRAGTGRVIGIMAAIAVVAVTVVVVSARAGGNSPDDPDVEETVPTTLAGGIPPGPVPDVVTAAFDAPVIGAVNMDNPPADAVASCGESMGIVWDDGQPEVEYAIATPDGIYLSLLGSGQTGPDMDMDMGGGGVPEKFRTSCSAQAQDGGWHSQGGGMEVVFEGEELAEDFGGSSYSCCDDQGLATASGSVEVPEDAEWAVQDRRGWYLAYPAAGRPRLTLTWKYRQSRFGGAEGPPQSPVTFLDAEGAVVGQSFAGGRF